MKSVLFGYVQKVINSPFGGQTLLGKWSDSIMVPNAKYFIHQYREETLIGRWKVKSFSSFPGNVDLEIGITVIPESANSSFEVGDIVVEDRADVQFWYVNNEFENVIVGIPENDILSLRLIIYPGITGNIMAISYHNGYKFSLPREIRVIGINEKIILSHQYQDVSDRNPLEVKIEYDKEITLKSLLNTMNPIRSFIIDAGEEYFHRASPSRRARRKLSVFEPAVQLKAGSIRILLSPIKEGQISLFAFPGHPYNILFKALSFAERGSAISLNQLLSSRFWDVRRYLMHLISIVRPFSKDGKMQFKLGDNEPLFLTNKSYDNIQTAISLLQKYTIEVYGELYAIDTKRYWFKVSDAHTGTDWKFIYEQEFQNQLKSQFIGEFVLVEGVTVAPSDALRGVAKLTRIISV